MKKSEVLKIIARNVELYSDCVAVRYKEEKLTYSELWNKAQCLANKIGDICCEEIIGISVNRNMNFVVGVLAIWMSDGAYIPLDLSLPEKRLEYIVKKAGIKKYIASIEEHVEINNVEIIRYDSCMERKEISIETLNSSLAYVMSTSGSTGMPKLVAIQHESVLSFLNAYSGIVSVKNKIIGSSVCPFYFDVSVFELFRPLVSGGAVVILDENVAKNPLAYKEALIRYKITSGYFPPFILNDLADLMLEVKNDICLECILVGVESIPQDTLQKWRNIFPALNIINGYGPTETTVCATFFAFKSITDTQKITPIGKALDGWQVEIVDEELKLVDDGKVGEIVIAGKGLMRGYIGSETEKTAIIKINNIKCNKEIENRWYRTGDLAYKNEDGDIVFCGRRDEQVKINGVRIDLGEIQNVLLANDKVSSVVICTPELESGKRLFVFVESKETTEEIKGYLERFIPKYMFPTRLISMNKFPITANGKVDRQKLLEISRERMIKTALIQPGSEIEKEIAKIWRELLGIDEIGINDDFYELGGDSRLALVAAIKVVEYVGDNLEISKLLVCKTISEVAKTVMNYSTALKREVQKSGKSYIELSDGQKGIWTYQKNHMDDSSFVMPIIVKFSKVNNYDLLLERLYIILKKYKVFSMCIGLEENTLVWKENKGELLTEMDLVISEDNLEKDILKHFQEEIIHVTKLDERIAKAFIVKTNCDNYILILLVHHIGIDGESANIIYEDISRNVFCDSRIDVNEVCFGAKQYINQYEEYIISKYYEEDRFFWKKLLAEDICPLDLSMGNIKESSNIQPIHEIPLSKERMRSVYRLKKMLNITDFETFFSIIYLLVYTIYKKDNFVISTPTSLRYMDTSLKSDVGYYVNLLPIRTNVHKGLMLEELMINIASVIRECRVHGRYPFERIVEDLLIEGKIKESNELTSIVVAEDVNNYELFSGDFCKASVLNIPKKNSIYNLTFFLKLKVNNPLVRIEYDPAKYTSSDILIIERCMNMLLDKIGEMSTCSIDDICSTIKSEKIERRDAFIEAVQRNSRMPQDDLISLFKDIARSNSKEIALEEESGLTITYSELDRLSDRIAYHILNSGCESDESILLISKRNAEFIIRILGVLKANCSYIPIDDKVPVYRMKQIVIQANVKRFMIAADYSNQEKVEIKKDLADLNCIEIECELEPNPLCISHKRNLNQAAYVMFTSGSTGKPKGVIVPDRGIIRLAKYPNFVNLSKSDVFILMSNISFDAATFEIWGTLLNGGKLYIPDSRIMNSPKVLLDRIHQKGITVGFINVTMFRWILEENIKALENMHTIVVGGEVVPPKLFIEASKYLAFDKLVNGYGPTENTTFTCCYRLNTNPIGMKHIPVGYSLEYSSTFVVDENMNLVPEGVEGEIIVSGAGVALGYIGDKEETNKVFIDFGKERGIWYKTGDIGVVQPDKSIICLGRKDNQVKIRGFRIEIDEIESIISSIKGVRDVAVLARDAIEGKRLEAYVVSNMQDQEIRASLKERIPDYMIPSKIYIIDEMPINEHGKKNRKELSEIGEKMKQKNNETKEKVNNQISIEQINSIFSEYLGVNEIDAKNRFFDMGFNSLLIAMIATTISKEYHLNVSSLDIIEHPTLTEFYAWLCEECCIAADKNDEIVDVEEKCHSQDIAVIGMFGRFPGCDDVDELWNHSIEGKIDVSSFETTSNKEIGVRGIIDDTDRFDAKFFGVTHRDAELMDPQQRVLLEVCQCAFDDAAIDVSSVNGPISVYATSAANEAEEKSDSLSEQYEKMLVTSSDLIAMQISYRLNLRGESVTVQTGCSSSMIAVSMACQSLLSNKAYISLAAGVSFPSVQEKGYYYEEGMITSKTGKCCPFDIKADGTVPGSGAAAVVLMRKEDAIAINAPIYALIKAISSNNDGASKVGFMAPSVKGQEEVIREAHKLANIEPREIEYVETHGTATKLGDAIEVKALSKLFKKSEANCAIGSIKANIGHLDRASGITGLIRTVKAVNSGIIPPMAGFTEENPDLHLNNTGLYIPKEKTEWKNKNRRIAGVSSFGVGGTNVHAIVESFDSDSFDNDTKGNYIVPLSSHQSITLNSQKDRLCEYLKQNNAISIKDVSATLIKGRTDRKYRTFFVSDSNDSLVKEMCSSHETIDSEGKRKVIWIFPGSGDKELDGFVEMYSFSNVYREALDKCIDIIEKYVNIDVKRILFSHSLEIKKSLKDNNVFQPVMFAIQWAHVCLWRSLGYEPDVVMGHSLGEVMAATVAGVFSLEDAVKVVIWRSEFMHSNSPEGIVLSVNMSSSEIQKLLPENTFVAVDNGKSLVAISGDADAVVSLKKHLDCVGVKSRYLMINRIVHSPMMKYAAEKLVKKLDSIQIKKAKIPIVSNVYGKVTDIISTSNYWGQHLCNMVRFRESLDFIANEYPNSAIFVVGPGKSIAAMISNEIEERMDIVYTVTNRNPEKVLLNTAGLFWQYGIDNNLESTVKKIYNQNNLYDDSYKLLHLPATAFDHSHEWNSKRVEIVNSYKNQDEKQLTRENDYGAWIWRYDFEKLEIKKDKRILNNSLVIYDVPEEGTYEFDVLKTDSNDNLFWVVNGSNIDIDIYNKAFVLRKKLNKRNVWICPLEKEETSIISNVQICKAILKCITLEIPDTNWHLVKGFMSLQDIDIEFINTIANAGNTPEVIQIYNGEVLAEKMVHSWPGFKPKKLRDNGIYVITGGTGRVAKSLIKAIGNWVSATIILIGRSSPDEKLVDYVETRNKVDTKYIALDITDQTAVNNLFNQLRVEYGRIDGVIHAAAQTNTDRFQLLGKVTEERMNEIIAAKVQGCLNIDNALLDTDADFIILCSSLSNELGGVGFSSYITANLYLNDFAKSKYSEGDTRWISVEWDAWTDNNIDKDDKGELKLAQFALDDKDGVNIFPFILAAPEPIISVSTADVKARRKHSIEMLARLSDDETYLDENNSDYKNIILGILQNTLGEIPEDFNQDLKEKGLESLSILQIIGKIRKATNKQLALGEVMNDLSVNGLLKLLDHDVKKEGDSRVPFEMSTVEHREMYPVSSTQRRWLLLMPEMYGGLDLVVKVTGNFEKNSFYDAVEKVVMAHSGIRTRFPFVNGDWVQIIENDTDIKEIDLRGISELQQNEMLKKIVEENTERWFDVENKVPFEIVLARISSEEYAMIIHAHHVLFDGTSSSIFMRDIARAMAGKKIEPEYQYVDYAVNQYKYVNGDDIIPYRQFWTKHFKGAKFPLVIPGDFECSVVDDYGDFVKFVIDKEMLKHMRDNANRRGVTIFNIMMAAFGLLLQQKTNENDLVIGTTVAGRPTVDTENIIGVFVNPLPLRLIVDPNMELDAYVEYVKSIMINFHDNSHYPMEDLTKYVHPFIGLGLNDTFQAYILYQNYWRPEETNMSFEKIDVGATTHHKLMREYELVLEEHQHELIGEFWYKTSKYTANTIQKDADLFIDYVRQIISQ